MDKVRILNIDVHNFTMNDLLSSLTKGIVFTPNVDHLVKLQKDIEFFRIYSQADYVVPDSAIIVALSKLIGPGLKERINGADLFAEFCRYRAQDENTRVFMLGGLGEVASRAKENINLRFGRRIVVDAMSPTAGFESRIDECSDIVDRINRSDANVLAVCVGAPKQEKWIAAYKSRLPKVDLFFAIGATIDFEAGTLRRAPAWMQRAGLEWLFRLTQDPVRLWKRYLFDDPPFLYYIALQILGLYRNPFG